MQRFRKRRQQNNFPSNPNQQRASQIQSVNQLNQRNTGIVFFILLLYLYMIFIIATLIIAFVTLSLNRGNQQIEIVCTFIILLLLVLFGCVLQLTFQISEANNKFLKYPEEQQMNCWLYKSSFTFFCQYSNTSYFSAIKLTYIYIMIAMLILSFYIVDTKFQTCNHKHQDQQSRIILQDENSGDNACTTHITPARLKGPMLSQLGIICRILAFIILTYEVSNIITGLMLMSQFGLWPCYQYNILGLNIKKVIMRSKVFCIIYLINHLFKFIALLIIMILTPNQSSKILIISNLTYHFIMSIVMLNLLSSIVKIDDEKIKNQLLVTYQLLIDFILNERSLKNRIFQLLLLMCLVFTIGGLVLFKMTPPLLNKIKQQLTTFFF